MKRLLAIFIVFLLVLGGLFWWRKNQNNLYYGEIYLYNIPLINNHTICKLDDKNTDYYLIDESNYQLQPDNKSIIHYFSDNFIIDAIIGDVGYYSLFLDIEKFYIEGSYITLNGTKVHRESNEGGYYKFDLTDFDYDSLRPIHPLSQDDLKKLKTYDEWLSIWKRDGRLPWFPEHVGR